MRLLHYGKEPFKFDPAHKYDGEPSGAYKPHGLWLSVEGDDDWKSWCEGENWRLDGLTHAYEVALKPDANVLVIDSLAKLDAFNTLYGTPEVYPRYPGISWEKVMAMHDGLIIAPYRWERRHDFMWYYGWDCASGVIWNLAAVESVSPIANRKASE